MNILYNASCEESAIGGIVSVIKNGLTIIQIVGPILALIMVSIRLFQLVKNPDDKKGLSKIKNALIALVVLFFIPMLVNVVFSWMGTSNDLSSCWNSSNNADFSGSSYMDIESNQNKNSLYTNPSDYQKGTPKPKENTNNSSNNSNNSNGSSTSGNNNGGGTGDRTGVGNTSASHVILLGDSRTVQMYAYATGDWGGANYSSGGIHEVGNDLYVAQGAMGLDWLKSTGIPAATPYFNSGSAIVILMGVNDLYNANNYINYVNNNASTWKSKGSSLYFVSVNPCNGSYSNLNSDIVNFNSKVKSGLANTVGWIDTYSVLTNNGFSTTDGLHYDGATYQTIYNYIKSKV